MRRGGQQVGSLLHAASPWWEKHPAVSGSLVSKVQRGTALGVASKGHRADWQHNLRGLTCLCLSSSVSAELKLGPSRTEN